MKSLLTIFIFSLTLFSFAQNKPVINGGTITLVNDEQIKFSNLRYEEDKIYYTNIETQLEENLFLESIKDIEENPSIVNEKTALTDSNIEKLSSSDSLKINQSGFPEGIYADLKSFQNKTPTESLSSFTFSQHENSELHYGFLNKEKKNFKKYFAVSYQGQLYINLLQIHKNYKLGSYTSGGRQNHWFFKANPSGKNIEVFGVFQANNSYLGVLGALGSLAGSGLSALSAKSVPVVYNEKIKGFAVIHNYIQLKKYIRKFYPESEDILEKVKEESRKEPKTKEELNLYIRSILKELD